ncbi:hypothetical protein H5P36_21080 [Bacillus sp. APMAM]|nr:hypothetical protein [Bacillus sp. APMAM]RTZ53897.1 hypothetical protein EKO25_20830 [Bacillus sp. SAJ1]
MKKKILKVIAPTILALSIPITALGTTYYYTGISLPALSGNWSSPDRTKATSDEYFKHQVTSMGGDYNYVNVWQIMQAFTIGGGNGQTTDKQRHRVGQPVAIANWTSYKGNGASGKGTPTNLIIENDSFTYVKVEASGNYDLR